MVKCDICGGGIYSALEHGRVMVEFPVDSRGTIKKLDYADYDVCSEKCAREAIRRLHVQVEEAEPI